MARRSLFSYINPFVFMISFGIGLLITYTIVPPPTVVIKFPNHMNAGKVTYMAKDKHCYKYKAEEVSCPLTRLDKDMVRLQPI
jgi:hypothetical protein